MKRETDSVYIVAWVDDADCLHDRYLTGDTLPKDKSKMTRDKARAKRLTLFRVRCLLAEGERRNDPGGHWAWYGAPEFRTMPGEMA